MSTHQAWARWAPVGWSKDCSCTSSSLTTPPTPSETTDGCRPAGPSAYAGGWAFAQGSAYAGGRPARATHRGSPTPVRTGGRLVAASPRREVAMASISSMKPIAPPSW